MTTDGDVGSDSGDVTPQTFEISDELAQQFERFQETQARLNKSLSRSLDISKNLRVKLPRVEEIYSPPVMDASPWVETQAESKRKIDAVAEDINRQVDIREAKELQREELEAKRFRWSLAITVITLIVATITLVFTALMYFQ